MEVIAERQLQWRVWIPTFLASQHTSEELNINVYLAEESVEHLVSGADDTLVVDIVDRGVVVEARAAVAGQYVVIEQEREFGLVQVACQERGELEFEMKWM